MDAKQENTMAMLCHLLGLIGFIGPLIIWLIKKDESALVDKNGKESLNFQISLCIYYFAAGILAVVLIGFLLGALVGIFHIVMVVMAAIKTSNGQDYRYPLCIRLIK
ncbi:MAG: DUF4870 domain-containing protein [Omnitrophica bacterium]|nr:DUF4870 domain-containing protein [Candidatus Omnitrophota bacterium]